MYVYIYILYIVIISIYICIYIYVYVYIYMYMYIYVYIYMYICKHIIYKLQTHIFYPFFPSLPGIILSLEEMVLAWIVVPSSVELSGE